MGYTTVEINGRKVILDENGKPCKSCNSLRDFQMMGMAGMGGAVATPPASNSVQQAPPEAARDPPDSWELGNHTWTFLHSMAAKYPNNPTEPQKQDMSTFISLFSRFYPCEPCAEDFQEYIKEKKPKVDSKESLSLWFCDAHNAVNEKLGKPIFDCKYWAARWKDGWEEFKRSQK